MNIVICGAGEVGRYSAEVMAQAGHGVTVVDRDARKLATLEETMDVGTLEGNGTQADVLLAAGCDRADLLIAATDVDEVNLLAAAVAKGLGTKQSIARVHHSPYFDGRGLDYAALLNIDHLVCPEYTTALAIAATLRNPGALAIEQFARGRIEMQRLRVRPGAKVSGQPLHALRLPGAARVGAVERNGSTFLAEASTVLEQGDVVTVVGDTDHFEKIRRQFNPGSETPRRIMIAGGTGQSVWLCRTLRERGFSIRLLEPDPARAMELAEKLPWVTVIRADAIHDDVLGEEHIEQTDAFIAMTEEDEQNILAAARAKTMGAKLAISVLQRATYLHLLSHVGIDRAFSPRAQAVIEIQRLMIPGPVRQVATLAEGVAEVYEVHVPDFAREVIGRPLREARFPPRCLLAAVDRGHEVFMPTAESELAAGDVVIIIGPPEAEAALRAMLVG